MTVSPLIEITFPNLSSAAASEAINFCGWSYAPAAAATTVKAPIPSASLSACRINDPPSVVTNSYRIMSFVARRTTSPPPVATGASIMIVSAVAMRFPPPVWVALDWKVTVSLSSSPSMTRLAENPLLRPSILIVSLPAPPLMASVSDGLLNMVAVPTVDCATSCPPPAFVRTIISAAVPWFSVIMGTTSVESIASNPV